MFTVSIFGRNVRINETLHSSVMIFFNLICLLTKSFVFVSFFFFAFVSFYLLLLLCGNERLGFDQIVFICLIYGEPKVAVFTFKPWNPVFFFGKVPENIIKKRNMLEDVT